MSFSDMFKTNVVTKVILIVLNLGLFALWRPEEQKIPLLELEVDYIPENVGQITTRVQAFCESILYARNNK